jgi:hypothetical protein
MQLALLHPGAKKAKEEEEEEELGRRRLGPRRCRSASVGGCTI